MQRVQETDSDGSWSDHWLANCSQGAPVSIEPAACIVTTTSTSSKLWHTFELLVTRAIVDVNNRTGSREVTGDRVVLKQMNGPMANSWRTASIMLTTGLSMPVADFQHFNGGRSLRGLNPSSEKLYSGNSSLGHFHFTTQIF